VETPVCKKQFCSYRDRPDAFAALGVTVVGRSAQSVKSHEDFIEKNNLTVSLLADVDGTVAKAYSAQGTYRHQARRDHDRQQGIVRHRHEHLLGLDYQSLTT
jgi:peroxiredoxin Q/BCP